MKPEKYPRETSCKYANVVTRVLEYFLKKNKKISFDQASLAAMKYHLL